MQPKLKPLAQQVIVITGATSGIGLSTARAAAGRGASLVLAARNEAALKTVSHDLAGKGAKVELVVADVGKPEDVARIAQAAIARFGGFDSWINNAGVGIFGPLTAVSLEDQRRLFDTDYWGVVHGSMIAVEHLRHRQGGGAVINVGSVLGDVAIPFQGALCTAKHAVHAYTTCLRMELAAEKAPVSVTLIRPGAVDTPLRDNARNYLGRPWRNPPPVYAAPLVAQTILYACEHRTRQITVGGLTGGLAFLAGLVPPLSERVIGWMLPRLTKDETDEPLPDRPGNLYKPGADLRERAWRPQVREQSLAVAAQMRPAATAGLAAAAVAVAAGCFVVGRRLRGRSSQIPTQ